MIYKAKIKTGEYNFDEDQDKIGEVEIQVKVPSESKSTAENISEITMGQLLNPKYIGDMKMQSAEQKDWSLYPQSEAMTLDIFEKKVVNK
tara:strand:- start:63 stop:332 length:270 start_codon:yes stop_codon:yes gene_type:complete